MVEEIDNTPRFYEAGHSMKVKSGLLHYCIGAETPTDETEWECRSAGDEKIAQNVPCYIKSARPGQTVKVDIRAVV